MMRFSSRPASLMFLTAVWRQWRNDGPTYTIPLMLRLPWAGHLRPSHRAPHSLHSSQAAPILTVAERHWSRRSPSGNISSSGFPGFRSKSDGSGTNRGLLVFVIAPGSVIILRLMSTSRHLMRLNSRTRTA